MESYNDPMIAVEEWFFRDDEPIGEMHNGDGITLSDQVAKIGRTFADWVDYDYRPTEPIVIDPLITMDVLPLESTLRRILNRADCQYLLLDMWTAWTECSVDAGPINNLWSRGKLILALWELEAADVAFESSRLYTRMLDEELAHFNWTHETMPAMLLQQITTVRDRRQSMLASESEARKNQLTLFELEDDLA